NRVYLVETPQDVQDLQPEYPDDIAFVTQTTLSVDDTQAVIDALKSRFPKIHSPRHDDICYATQNRQDAVKQLSSKGYLLPGVGSVDRSNPSRLRELAETRGMPAYLADGAEDIRDEWREGAASIGVTAGASAPESRVQEVIGQLKARGSGEVEEL